ncbi:hypothetical protein Ae201684P_013821 [Aphanomyces euteiches]|nr:hypothetical protein Ae201684P_013821 [Aphanomyces euteiches]
MSLGEHQKEILALARQQNVLVCGKSGIGKTFASAFFIREVLMNEPQRKVLVLVAGSERTNQVYQMLNRLCSEHVAGALNDTEHRWRDPAYSKDECTKSRILCVSPAIASNLFHLGHISFETLALIVLEDTEEIYATAATFAERLSAKYSKLTTSARPKLLAMVSKPLSQLHLPTTFNPLYQLLTAFSIIQPTFRKRSSIAPILVEAFQYETVNYSDAVGHPVDFLHGANGIHCNIEAVFQSLLNLGNPHSQYDVLTIESRRTRFVTTAEAILEQLGLWCFLKFIELELCNVLNEALKMPIHDGMNFENLLGSPKQIDASSPRGDNRVEQHADVQQARSCLEWIIGEQGRHGLGAAHSRLKKVADLFGSYMDHLSHGQGRAWVFLQRRAHTRVVAEYLTACFPNFPPCCSLHGNGQASVARGDGSDQRASYVETLFNEGKTPLIVSTAICTEDEQLALCDLVISMDEVVDPHKLLDFRQRADPNHGVFKYIIPDTPSEYEKYKVLFQKMATLLHMDQDQGSIETLDQTLEPQKNRRNGHHSSGRSKYELYHADVKAKMTLENSIQILTAFCHTLPGIKIYDNRPLYMIKRHLVGGAEARKRMRFRPMQALTRGPSDDDGGDHRRFVYSASLKLPSMLRMKSNINTPRVSSDKLAKCIAAFKAVEELLKRGFVDRSFKSKLIVNRDAIPQNSVDEDMEISTQNSYDIPPITADGLNLPTIKSKLSQEQCSMHLYRLEGMRYGILCTEPLFRRQAHSSWRFELATSDIMEPAVRTVKMCPRSQTIDLEKTDLILALRFHVLLMRLICQGPEAAMKTSADVTNEFASKNDKGYIVVPILPKLLDIDWEWLRDIVENNLLRPAWPMDNLGHHNEWIYVSNKRRNIAYVVKEITKTKVGDIAQRVVSNEQYWNVTIRRAKSAPGVPILGRWYTKDALLDASPDQPLVYGIELPSVVPLIRFVHERKTQLDYGHLKERLLIPDQTSVLALTNIYKNQRQNLLMSVWKHWVIASLNSNQHGGCISDVKAEGTLSMMRGDMIRNDRLCKLSLSKKLHHSMVYPADFEQQPFRSWTPSCVGRAPEPVMAHMKWIADVLESTCGAYIQGSGEFAGRTFLEWTGCSVCEAPQIYNRKYFPECIPQPLPELANPETPRDLATWDLTHLGYDDVPERMYLLQTCLKYNFRDKRLLLEAITHPSVAQWLIHADKTTTNVVWKGDYERLEYLGDALIEYLVVTYAYIQYPTWQPGALSDWKGATVCNDSLGKAALIRFHIDQIMLTGSMRMDPLLTDKLVEIKRLHAEGCTELPQVSMPKIFADGFEALCAAVFLDSGCDLHVIRDVFLGPLLEVIGHDAVAVVTRRNAPKPVNLGVAVDDADIPTTNDAIDEVDTQEAPRANKKRRKESVEVIEIDDD